MVNVVSTSTTWKGRDKGDEYAVDLDNLLSKFGRGLGEHLVIMTIINKR